VGVGPGSIQPQMSRLLSADAGTLAGGDNILWMSVIVHLQDKQNGSGIHMGLGDSYIGDRGQSQYLGSAFAGTAGYTRASGWNIGANAIVASGSWSANPDVPANYNFTDGGVLGSEDDFVVVFKYIFGATALDVDTVEVYAFPETEALAEGTFDTNKASASHIIDESTMDRFSVALAYTQNTMGAIRIGQSFADITSFPTAGAVVDSDSWVVASPVTVDAGGSTSTITVTLLDADGVPVPSKTVSLAGSVDNAVTDVSPVTNAAGQATFTVSSSTAGPEVFTATDTTDAITVIETATVTFIGLTDAATSTMTLGNDTIVANGNSSTTITVTLKDAGGSLIVGNTVSLAGDTANATITASPLVSDSNGQVTFEVTSSTTVETEVFTATDDTDTVTVTQTASVAFVAEDAPALLALRWV